MSSDYNATLWIAQTEDRVSLILARSAREARAFWDAVESDVPTIRRAPDDVAVDLPTNTLGLWRAPDSGCRHRVVRRVQGVRSRRR